MTREEKDIKQQSFFDALAELLVKFEAQVYGEAKVSLYGDEFEFFASPRGWAGTRIVDLEVCARRVREMKQVARARVEL